MIAAAPVSYGVFGGVRLDLPPQRLLTSMAEAGYTGSELGPPGFFGTPQQTATMFAEAGLTMVGAYAPLHLSGPDSQFTADLTALRTTLTELQAAGNPGALAILADEGDAALIRHPFRAPGRGGLDAAGWRLAAERVGRARALAQEHGIDVSFHPHFATYVEQAAEIDTLMELTDVPLCLDTGHFHLGGADPVTYLRRYAGRINHVHVKDLHVEVVRQAQAAGLTDLEAWWAQLCCPLGTGDVELRAFVTELRQVGYSGWLVVEQDRAAVTAATWDAAVTAQRANHTWLAQAW
jgi:inosose dehydratase